MQFQTRPRSDSSPHSPSWGPDPLQSCLSTNKVPDNVVFQGSKKSRSMSLSLHFCLRDLAAPPTRWCRSNPCLKRSSLVSKNSLSDEPTAMQSQQSNSEVTQVQQGQPDSATLGSTHTLCRSVNLTHRRTLTKSHTARKHHPEYLL